jgi:hypothetical protein
MNILGQDYKYYTTSAAKAAVTIEYNSIEDQKDRFKTVADGDMLKRHTKATLRDVPNWLPLAAEKYNISPHLKDYILTPVVSLPSDIPNSNCQSFSFKELTSWVISAKMPMYKTWAGSPGHNNHINSCPAEAKGIIFSSIMEPIKNSHGDLWKVIQLVGWDRNRDPLIANEILTKKRTHYSIGAYTQDYDCSICGQLYSKAESTGMWCEHLTDVPKFNIFNGKLAYWNVIESVGFEISTLDGTGAYYSTHGTPFFEFGE